MTITGKLMFKWLMVISIIAQSLFLLGYVVGIFPSLNVGLSLIFIATSLVFYLALTRIEVKAQKKS